MEYREFDPDKTTQTEVPPSLIDDERLMGVLAWVTSFTAPIIGPLVIYFINAKNLPFIEHHAKNSLNVSISAIIYAIIALLTLIIPPLALLLIIGIIVYVLIVVFKGIRAAARYERYKPPLTIPFLS